MGHIDWIPIDEVPDMLKDGREVLIWAGTADDGWPAIGRWLLATGQDHAAWIDTKDGFPEPLASFIAEVTSP